MKIEKIKGKIYFVGQTVRATEFKKNIDFITQLSNWPVLAEQFIHYNVGKSPKSVTSWLARLIPILREYLETSSINKLPSSTSEWTLLIRSLYVITISSAERNSSISTRVAEWNKNIKPFLYYLQSKDIISFGVIIPIMKTVSQRTNNSSFNVSLIGESPAIKVGDQCIKNLLIPISLSRSDVAYLDELYFDLEKTRNHLFSCLKKYWRTIKSYYELGESLLSNFDSRELEKRILNKDFYDCISRGGGNRIPPLRPSIFLQNTTESLVNFLYIIKTRIGCYHSKSIRDNIDLPPVPAGKTLEAQISLTTSNAGVESLIESEDSISIGNKVNWLCGVLTQREISFIVALLMMDNPKFTLESLLNCQMFDNYGKSYLEENAGKYSFSIIKNRAKKYQTEQLSVLSAEIIKTLIRMREGIESDLIDDKYKSSLLLALSTKSCTMTPLHPGKAYKWLSGSPNEKCYGIKNCFPSLCDYGLGAPGLLSHKKLRDSEAVLEFFRTGSVRAVSKILGNTQKVALQHYIPEPLITAYNTRLIRRFQNLLIIASVAKEDYLLEAVDFNSLDELNNFISDMVSLDSKGTNPMLSIIKESFEPISSSKNVGELIASISEKSLTYLHAYRLIAERKNISAEVLNRPSMAVTPLSIITLSKFLNQVLVQHQKPTYRKTNEIAVEKAEELSIQLNWGDLLLSIEKIS